MHASTIELVIFDCDGVLVDTEPVVIGILAERLRTLGMRISDGECAREFIGLSQKATLARVAQLLGRPVQASWVDELTRTVDAALAAQTRAVAGVPEMLAALTVPYCVASNGRAEKLAVTLSAAGLLPMVEDRVFTADQVAAGKPAPDLFLFAAHQMEAVPTACVVVEDSRAGVMAAQAAGMRVLGFAGGTNGHAVADADVVFRSMLRVPLLLESLAHGKAMRD